MLATLLLFAAACFPAKTPLQTSFHDGARDDVLVVLMPGFGAHDRTFAKQGIVQAARDAGVDADMLAVDATYGYYVRGQLETRLAEDVIPLARKYDHVWVLGISMGGLGALLTAKDFPDVVDGVVALSPYLGRGKTQRAVREASSLGAYTPPADPAWDEELWGWMTQLETAPDALPPILLGHGDRDLGPDNLEYFGDQLPNDRVWVVPGGHTWKTWRVLVGEVAPTLASFPAFASPPVAEADGVR